jgi:hypothetical protein
LPHTHSRDASILSLTRARSPICLSHLPLSLSLALSCAFSLVCARACACALSGVRVHRDDRLHITAARALSREAEWRLPRRLRVA